MNERLQKIYRRIEQAVHSSRGRDVLLYLLCVCIAFVFWLFLSLDTEVQRDFNVPLELVDVPDSITVLGKIPSTVEVNVKAKDSQLLRFEWGGMSAMKLRWSEYVRDGQIAITKAKLDTRVRDYFGQSAFIVAIRPDSIMLPYTTLPGRKVKLIVNADLEPNFQYVISGPVKASFDSVTIYSPVGLPHSLTSVETEPLIRSGMKDTTSFEIAVKPIEGCRIIPDKVTVTVPVEPLIAKNVGVQVTTSNVPANARLITFPSKVTVSYLVPISRYNDEYLIKAFVNYNDARRGQQKLPVTLSKLPAIFRSPSINPDSVEYILEKVEL
ncbi:MAG: hypothetical protein HDS56_06465 [Barnesiella sp.]|nr:hypothetical protein [Bacteroidales bacterium]MBD5250802.1 hypothetical protein [Barnesiella sp.]MBD5343780.1 hypothetical protein [Bacteroides sp.]